MSRTKIVYRKTASGLKRPVRVLRTQYGWASRSEAPVRWVEYEAAQRRRAKAKAGPRRKCRRRRFGYFGSGRRRFSPLKRKTPKGGKS